MARTEIERTVQPSLFDRLTDLHPGEPEGRLPTRDESERDFRRAVERDVEALFNTRRTINVAPESCPELHNSVHEFGLIDTTAIPVGTARGRDRLVNAMADAIARFEPRLGEPRVRLLEADQVKSPQVRFVLEATLRMDPDPEQV